MLVPLCNIFLLIIYIIYMFLCHVLVYLVYACTCVIGMG